ncbi:hypothetical protein NKH18_05575 [Streptomyces sp. M10(2022)]
MYVYATDPEAFLPEGRFVEEVRTVLRRYAAATDDASLDALVRQAADWVPVSASAISLSSVPRGRGSGPSRRAPPGARPPGRPRLRSAGPHVRRLAAVAQRPGNADDPWCCAFSPCTHPTWARATRGLPGSAYLELLRRLRLAENAAPAVRLTGDQRITDGAFRLPALLLAMSRRPDDFRVRSSAPTSACAPSGCCPHWSWSRRCCRPRRTGPPSTRAGNVTPKGPYPSSSAAPQWTRWSRRRVSGCRRGALRLPLDAGRSP